MIIRVFRSKRGVSPLIATILLIAFAVSLGAVVMQFGEASVSGVCGSNIQISIPKPCIDGSGAQAKIRANIKNNGGSQFEGIAVVVKGSNIGMNREMDIRIGPGAQISVPIPFDTNVFGSVQSVSIMPRVTDNGAVIACSQNTIDHSQIFSC